LFEELAKPNYAAFETLFTEGAASGVLKSYPAGMLTLIAHGAAACMFNLAMIAKMLIGSDPFNQELVELQADMVVDVLLNGLTVSSN
jgi:Tetracyclin repressor-like, C-terminal domain